jgi:hypothetical protein
MSADIVSSPLLPELPPEIWLKIFRIATFIPRETDLSATTVEPGLFCSYDEYQARDFEPILPLRRTIVLVSRRFYQIGAEVLYTTFHGNAGRINNPDRRLSLFSDLLVSRPELGRFVRRLSLQWSAGDEEKNYQIVTRCPHVMIFSSFIHPCYTGYVPWWRRGLPKTIRSFDANVLHVPIKDILKLLQTLPHLELLHLHNMRVDSIPHVPVCLSALRILSVYTKQTERNAPVESHISILSTIQLPRLAALATNVGEFDVRLSFPLEVWRGLEYFQPNFRSHIGLRPDYFRSLRRLYLTLSEEGVETYLAYFPFRQLECLKLQTNPIFFMDTWAWQQRAELLVDLPLHKETMPMLRLFQLDWEYVGIYKYYRQNLRTAVARARFIQHFETLAERFEQRGVLFVETHRREICLGYQPIREVLALCKES